MTDNTRPMDEQVERVAKAIVDTYARASTHDHIVYPVDLEAARAAIEAMRETGNEAD